MPFFKQTRKKIEQFGLSTGSIVADLGAGTGFYTFPLAEAVGGFGQVIAVDIFSDHLSKIETEAQRRGFDNIAVLQADLEAKAGSKIKAGSLDAVVAANIFFQIKNKDNFIAEIYRILKKNGRVLLIDWQKNGSSFAPNQNLLLDRSEVEALFESHDFAFLQTIKVAEHKFGLIFRKKPKRNVVK